MRSSMRAIVAAVTLLTASAGAEAAAGSDTLGGRSAQCAVRGNAARLSIRCPSAPLAELLNALNQATGLRSTYPSELARARVSVTVRSAPLSDVLKTALAEFNFATWVDQSTPNVTQLSIVGMRRAVDDGGPALVPEAASTPIAERRPSAPVHTERRRAQPPDMAAAATTASPPQTVITGAPPSPSTPAQAQQQVLRPTPAPTLEVAAPSAYLLSPPSSGRSPVLPQRSAETPVLRPGMPPESAAN